MVREALDQRGWVAHHESSELHFEPGVSGGEPQAFIELVSTRPLAVAGQLYQHTATQPALFKGPFKKSTAQSLISHAFVHTNSFDLSSPGPHSRQVGNKRQLQCSYDGVIECGNSEKLIGVCVYRFESLEVGNSQGDAGIFSGRTQGIVGEQRDDGLKVVNCGAAHRYV